MTTQSFPTFRVLAVLLALHILPAAQIPPQVYPPQPTATAVIHRSGQTFITWTERGDLDNESYRIYRSRSGPIISLGGATLLYEVWEGSGEFYADRIQQSGVCGPDPKRYAKRFVITDGGAEVAPDQGLLVWTLADQDFGSHVACPQTAPAWFAVTTVSDGGIENTFDFDTTPGGNAGAPPVSECIADPLPVRLAADPNHPGIHIFIQYMDLRSWNPTFDAPNFTNGWWGELEQVAGGGCQPKPMSAGVRNAIQYAYAYKVAEPRSICGPFTASKWPVILQLHIHSGNRQPANWDHSPYCAIEIRPIDVGDTWWFGFSTDYDYRAQAVPGYPTTGTVANFTERRVLRMIHDLSRDPALGPFVDRDRVYVEGHSMGGSGSLACALRYPDVFAAAHASKPMTDYRAYYGAGMDYAGELLVRWGAPTPGLSAEIDAPEGWADHLQPYVLGASVWSWQKHQLQFGRLAGENMVPFGAVHSVNDSAIPFDTQGDPAIATYDGARQAWGARVDCLSHCPSNFRGLPPSLGFALPPTGPQVSSPFVGLTVVRTETVPGLSNVRANGVQPCLPPSTCPLPCQPVVNCNPAGQPAPLKYAHDLTWSASWNNWGGAPVDSGPPNNRWEMTLGSVGPPTTQYTADVTPRRLGTAAPGFVAVPGAWYNWFNAGTTQQGTVQADAAGTITIQDVMILQKPSGGNRLVIY